MRWIVGILLVSAAILKAVQLIIEPTVALATGGLSPPVQVGVELAVGLLALTGSYWRQLRWIALLLFVGFAGYSLYLATSGATSCGCFGALRVHPWLTFFLDVAVAIGLVVSVVHGRSKQDIDREGDPQAGRFFLAWRTTVAGAMSVSIIATALLVRYVNGRTAVAEGITATSSGLVILEPETWLGKKFPIAYYIDMDLSKGNWTVLLHRHNCTVCQQVIPRYEKHALSGQQVALVEVPPYGEFHRRESACYHTRLKNHHNWFVQTPVVIQLQDGIVTQANYHGT